MARYLDCNLPMAGAQDSAKDQRLQEAVRYASLGGGKRLRPLLCYAAARAAGGGLEDGDAPAMAVEFMHCYSLIHDDLPAMDDDDLRRGQPSLHRAFDEATGILSGDMLQSFSFRVLAEGSASESQPNNRLRMLQILGEAAGDMVHGQSLDFAATGHEVDERQLTLMHRLKTGALIRASVLLGALSVPSMTSESTLRALGQYAEHIGLAFQIQDDILDETGSTAALGKPQGSDRNARKTTFITLLGLEAAKQRAEALRVDAIAALSGQDENADMLRHLATYIVNRAS